MEVEQLERCESLYQEALQDLQEQIKKKKQGSQLMMSRLINNPLASRRVSEGTE